MTKPIDLYSWPTPNSWKIAIFFEEVGMAYNVIPVNIGAGDQFAPDFLKISPNNKMPAIVDHDGPGGQPLAVFESGSILMYLAEKTGQFWPQDDMIKKYSVAQWLMFQMASVGPMFGQANHFRNYAPEKLEYAINRYNNEQMRIYGVMDTRLKEVPYLAGDFYSIADMATVAWCRGWKDHGVTAESHPSFVRWYEELTARPAVTKAFDLQKELRRPPGTPPDEKAREILFGSTQYQRR